MAATSLALAGDALSESHARWLELVEAGIPAREIARRYRVCVRTVRRGLARLRDERIAARHAARTQVLDEPPLTPRYGCKPFTPQTTCADIHPRGPIPRGDKAYCEVCGQTGCEGHPLFQRMPGDATPCRLAQDPNDDLAGGTGKVSSLHRRH